MNQANTQLPKCTNKDILSLFYGNMLAHPFRMGASESAPLQRRKSTKHGIVILNFGEWEGDAIAMKVRTENGQVLGKITVKADIEPHTILDFHADLKMNSLKSGKSVNLAFGLFVQALDKIS